MKNMKILAKAAASKDKKAKKKGVSHICMDDESSFSSVWLTSLAEAAAVKGERREIGGESSLM